MAPPGPTVIANPPEPAGTPGPLSPQHLAELAKANKRAKTLRRAIGAARFNGWMLGACALVCVLMDLTGPLSWLLGAGLGVAAYIEFHGAARLRRLEPAATRWLGFNQIGLGGLLIAYAVWQILAAAGHPPKSALDDPALAGLQGMEDMKQLERILPILLYGALIAIALIYQGGNAWYYFTRARHLRAYVQETPAWIVELQRSGVNLS
jgi:hypothetical protein